MLMICVFGDSKLIAAGSGRHRCYCYFEPSPAPIIATGENPLRPTGRRRLTYWAIVVSRQRRWLRNDNGAIAFKESWRGHRGAFSSERVDDG